MVSDEISNDIEKRISETLVMYNLKKYKLLKVSSINHYQSQIIKYKFAYKVDCLGGMN